jgi:hypothetical protein
MTEYARPWKLFSLAAGIALLVAGSFYYQAPDWDIPISLIMAAFAYLSAPWSLRVVVEPVALEMMRDANFAASLVSARVRA